MDTPLVALLGLGMLACDGSAPPNGTEVVDSAQTSAFEGSWRATLVSRGGPLPFSLRILEEQGTLVATAHNGPTAVPFTSVAVDDRGIVLRIDGDSVIRANLDGSGQFLLGAWTKQTAEGPVRMPFSAAREPSPRFTSVIEAPAYPTPTSVEGDWSIVFRDEAGSTWVGLASFTSKDGVLSGTLHSDGEAYRDLEGRYSQGTLELSFFDGNRAFLLRAMVQEDGRLRGDFWSGASRHMDWTGTRVEAQD